MRTPFTLGYPFAAIALLVLLGITLPLSGVFASKKSHDLFSAAQRVAGSGSDSSEAARLNSIGVAYMNQQRFADAQKQFDACGSKDKTFRVYTAEEGGAQHCQRDYLTLVVAEMWNWFDEKLNRG